MNNIQPETKNVSLPLNLLEPWIRDMLPEAIKAGCAKCSFIAEAIRYAIKVGNPDTKPKLKAAKEVIFANSKSGTNRKTEFDNSDMNKEFDTKAQALMTFFDGLSDLEKTIARARFKKQNPGLQISNHKKYKSKKAA